MSSSDSTSVTLTWKKPQVQNGNDVKGYEVEMKPYNSPSWTKCFTLPADSSSCRVQGLQPGEKLLLRVRALGDSGPGEASELQACAGAAPVGESGGLWGTVREQEQPGLGDTALSCSCG